MRYSRTSKPPACAGAQAGAATKPKHTAATGSQATHRTLPAGHTRAGPIHQIKQTTSLRSQPALAQNEGYGHAVKIQKRRLPRGSAAR